MEDEYDSNSKNNHNSRYVTKRKNKQKTKFRSRTKTVSIFSIGKSYRNVWMSCLCIQWKCSGVSSGFLYLYSKILHSCTVHYDALKAWFNTLNAGVPYRQYRGSARFKVEKIGQDGCTNSVILFWINKFKFCSSKMHPKQFN